MFSNDQLYSDDDMGALVKRTDERPHDKASGLEGPKYGDPVEQPRVAIQRMRSVVGGFIYLNEKTVNTIFVNQVNRIDKQIENLERILPNYPRKMSKTDPTTRDKRAVTFDPWKHQSLEKKWYEYMDGVYNRANGKGVEFMNKNIKRLKDEYNDGKMLKQADVDKEKDPKKKAELTKEKDLREAMKSNIDLLEKERSKRKDWLRPKWNT